MRKEVSNEKVNYSNISKAQAKEESVKENFETEVEKKEEVKEDSAPKSEEKKEKKKDEKKASKNAIVYNCEELNVRSTPDTNGSNIIFVAKKGSSYRTTGEIVNGFVEIEFNGGKAYGMKQYLDVK